MTEAYKTKSRNTSKNKKPKKKLGKKYCISLSALFICYIVFFVAVNTLGEKKTFSETENRVLQSKPTFSVEKLFEGRYISKYEKYKVDQFFNRDFWIDVKVKTDKLLLKKSSNGVYLGKDGYLLEDFEKPNEENVSKNLKAISDFSNKYKDVKQYMLISPTAVSILRDKLPLAAPVIDQQKYLDEYSKKLDSNVTFVDTYATLLEHKREDLYYKSDHHWTTLGAFYSYQKLAEDMELSSKDSDDYDIELVSNSFEGALASESGYKTDLDKIKVYIPKDENDQVVVNYEEEQKKTATLYDSEKLEQKDKYQVFLGGNHPIVKIDTTSDSGKTLLIFKDSYANCFIQFLTTHFSKIILVDPRYYYEDIDELMKNEDVDEVLYLYNANTFFSDTSLAPVLNNE
ncbi:DHHW family protein [Intestinibacter sp.]|uniref:DHHW family protein n=1 Tax=Intestinibacter sp. TaxID=1965304 RepID=UPI002A765082|nr:DHHW family protein [Intestinibacter sp.]MDY2735987.1 DHHW family protein [Intestinibacter sp.]MDY4574135.1 DHHW family protein [Intestinibacter sp.]